ncbi:hypothetical protein [Mycobacteroides chelonae]|uniref:hypothetical protein n=1 Tax=Mycobacteroides chelonae TaxID=1774 RepID=UPI000AB4DCB2|nr:hypothetical protein [Mycobacteroides chelonae]
MTTPRLTARAATTSDAARLEALGATEAEVMFGGHTIRVPLNLEVWPLHLVRQNPIRLVDYLLNGQESGLGDDVTVDDYRELSDAMAEAVGVSRLPETPDAPDQWFGGIPTLVNILDNHEDDLASDLRHFWGVRYAERFTGTLSLREIWSYVRRLQPTSAIVRAQNGGKEHWTEQMFITAAVYQALTGEIYPGRPLKPEELAKAIEAMQAKAEHVATLREREAAYAAQSSPTAPAVSAMEQAIANRRQELGTAENHG